MNTELRRKLWRGIAVVMVGVAGLAGLADVGAQRGDRGDRTQKDPPPSLKIPPAPVLSPEDALESFEIVDGFRIEIVASEPLIHDPVAIQIDGDGRIWVVEMQSYMPDVDGKGEDEPISRIVVLADTDGDGRMDKSHLFLDKLVLPRALQFVKGGVLYADQQNLHYVPVLPGYKAGEAVVVDDRYSSGGNVEHKANGLLRGLDNWLYSAKSSSRYRLVDGKWEKEATEGRGQWGICQDDYGRLYYNGNSSNVQGDWVPPGAMMRNPDLAKQRWAGTRQGIVGSTKVFPIRVTTGVNRGYQNLDENFKLRGLTSACGPLVYRGNQFPEEFYGNVFTPAPCCHIIKRNILSEKDARVKGEQAYKDREFLASTDERFRPVALCNAPDGSIYVVDFYRGILQHKSYVTSYLKRQILSRNLDKPTGLGRIYRIASTEGRGEERLPKMSKESPKQWVAHLSHANSWWRETAQRLLVDRGDRSVTPDLVELCGEHGKPLGQIHALWTLEGLGAVTTDAIRAAAGSDDSKVLASAIRVGEANGGAEVLKIMEAIAGRSQHADVDLQLAFSLGRMEGARAMELLADVVVRRGKDDLFTDAALSGLRGREREFLAELRKQEEPERFEKMISGLSVPFKTRRASSPTPPLRLAAAEKKLYDTGKTVYESFCIGCHKDTGEGVVPLGPPLVNSEWVTGSEKRLAAIILNGVQGPITVDGERYAAPDIQPLMPGIRENKSFGDERIAAVMTYVRNSFGNRAPPTQAGTVAEARAEFADHDVFSEAALKRIK